MLPVRSRTSTGILLAFLAGLDWIIAEEQLLDHSDEENAGIPQLQTREFYPGPRRFEPPCMYAIESEEEANAVMQDASIAGNVVNVKDLSFDGRLGNHFGSIARALSVGYCCKSRVVSLPPKDSVLAPGIFSEGTPGPRHFSFSSADDVPGFNSSECKDDYAMNGGLSFFAFMRTDDHPNGRFDTPNLLECMDRTPRVLACEAAYYFPRDISICPFWEAPTNAGKLVVHIRSGDIFSGHVNPNILRLYGQPPLSYYLWVLSSHDWDSVDIVTFAATDDLLNPVVPVLQTMIDTDSLLQSNVTIYTDRDIATDVQAMLCADALATSRSTLEGLTLFHSRATQLFGVRTCTGTANPSDAAPVLPMLMRSRRTEGVEIHGVDWNPDAPKYTQSTGTTGMSETELLEMLEYTGMRGLIKCADEDIGG